MSVQIMDGSGDTRHEFDAFDADSVARLEERFHVKSKMQRTRGQER